MPHYRIYFMNSSNGHIDRADDLQARDDREAIATAAPLAHEQPIELWSGTRKVHRFEPPSTAFLEHYGAHKSAYEGQAAHTVELAH